MSLRHELDRYLTVRRSLGYNLGATERVLRRFVAFAEAERAPGDHRGPSSRWQSAFGQAGQQTWAGRFGMVRLFAQWLQGCIPPTRSSARAHPEPLSAHAALHLQRRGNRRDRR